MRRMKEEREKERYEMARVRSNGLARKLPGGSWFAIEIRYPVGSYLPIALFLFIMCVYAPMKHHAFTLGRMTARAPPLPRYIFPSSYHVLDCILLSIDNTLDLAINLHFAILTFVYMRTQHGKTWE